ncbi:MAG: YitT family protein [Lachnospiraceae bacterium]|nr:YitT family protein [Lachnospiraceae bacterium]
MEVFSSDNKALKAEREFGQKREEQKPLKEKILDYSMITLASALYGAGVSLFIDPCSLAPGGVTGVAIILSRLLFIETGKLIMLLNIPILCLGIWKFGIRFMVSTFYATLMTSFFTTFFAGFSPATEDVLLGALGGSVLIALSMGTIFKQGSTTGGMDIIIKCLRLKFPYIKTGVLYLITDVCIVGLSAVVFGKIDLALYGGIAVVVTSTMLDLVLYGKDEAKLIYIISDFPEQITGRLLEELEIGVTYLRGAGAYSRKEKDIIMCVVRKSLSFRVEEVVKDEDAEAFMIVTRATEIFGEGYKSYFGERL